MRIRRNVAIRFRGRGEPPLKNSDYVVLAVTVSEKHTVLHVVSETNMKYWPMRWDAHLFRMVDDRVPSNWVSRLNSEGGIELAPEAWLDAGFWSALDRRVPEAVALYKRERNLILQAELRQTHFAMPSNVAQLRHVHKPYIATLATVRGDGSPHVAPVWFRYEDGVFFVLTEGGSKKARNIRRDPRVELCIDDRERVPYHTVIVRGRARIEAYPGDVWRLALAVHYLGEEGGRRYVETTPAAADEVLIRIDPEQITGW